MLLDAILKAIKDIESMDKRTKKTERILNDLKDTVNTRMKQSLPDFISVGEKMSYEEIKRQLNDLPGLLIQLRKRARIDQIAYNS